MSWHVLSSSYTSWWKYLLIRAIDILAVTHCFTMCNGCFLGSNMPYIQWISAIRVWTVTDISVDIYTLVNSLHGVVNVASGLRRSDIHGELVASNHLSTSILWLTILRSVICKPIRRDSVDDYRFRRWLALDVLSTENSMDLESYLQIDCCCRECWSLSPLHFPDCFGTIW